MIISLLAVLKAGGAYLPLDPDYPAGRLEFMIKDSGTEILVTHSGILSRLNTTAEQTLCLDEVNSSIANQVSDNPDCPIIAHNLAYVIYTSGSTGKPKGVAIEHAAFAMAQILLKRGEEIGLLAIADTFAPGSSVYSSTPDFDMLQYLSYIIQNKLTVRQEEIDSLNSEEQLDYFGSRFEEAKIFPEGKGTEYLYRLANIAGNNIQMQNSYFTESFIRLPITLIRAIESELEQAPLQKETEEDFGWSRYSSNEVDLHYVPGNHMTMMNPPNVENLAQILTRIIG